MSNEVINILLTYAPQIATAITTIVSVIVGIKKVASAGKDSAKELKAIVNKQAKENEELKDQLRVALQDNQEIKAALKKVNNKLGHIREE